jgi:hypothetical protein
MPFSEKKGRRLAPPPAFRPLPRVFYRYPATIPAKLPDAISRLLRTSLPSHITCYRAATAVRMKVTRLFATALTSSPTPA